MAASAAKMAQLSNSQGFNNGSCKAKGP